MLFYIWLRFEWQFALGAVAALIHDIVLTIGIFSLFQIPFDLAHHRGPANHRWLFAERYGLWLFDRVRENLRKFKKLDLKGVLEPVDQRYPVAHGDDICDHSAGADRAVGTGR